MVERKFGEVVRWYKNASVYVGTAIGFGLGILVSWLF